VISIPLFLSLMVFLLLTRKKFLEPLPLPPVVSEKSDTTLPPVHRRSTILEVRCVVSQLSRFLLATAGGCMVTAVGYAQSVISAKAGLVHYTEGKVFIADKEVAPKNGDFPEMKAGEVLRTEEGRAEVLLTPGVVLRIAENSSFKLIGNKVEDIRLEMLAGSVLIEAGEVNKHDSIVITAGGASVDINKNGLFRIDASPASLRVYDGQAVVTSLGQTLTVKEGKQTALTGVLSASKFDKESGDAFHRWAGRRSGYLAVANVSAAKSIYDSGRGWGQSGWFFNPFFGCFTFIPAGGNYFSPFGYRYYTPRRVESVFYRPAPMPTMDRSLGWADPSIRHGADVSGRSAGYSGGGMSSAPAPPPSSAPAAPAGGPRSGDSGSSRNSGGGR